jgi:glycosyltransferase involved in cell wall biosynthesis
MQEDLHTLAEGAVKAGHRVIVITTRHPDGLSMGETRGVEIYYLQDTIPESYTGGFYGKAYQRFTELDRQVGFDLVYSQSLAALAFTGKVRQPIVARLHGVWFSESDYAPLVWRMLTFRERLETGLRLPAAYRTYRRLQGFATRVDRILVDSQFSLRELLRTHRQLDPSKVRCIYPGIDVDKFRPLEREMAKQQLGLSGIVFLYLSRLSVAKGARLALRAFNGLNGKDVTLLISGEGPDRPYLEAEVTRRRITGIRFCKIPDDQRVLYYSAADLFLYPELTQPAFGLVGAEAMACGVPVIGAKHGAIPEVLGEGETFFTPGDADDLREKIATALDDLTRLQALAPLRRDRIVRLFSSKRMVSSILNECQALLSGADRPNERKTQ